MKYVVLVVLWVGLACGVKAQSNDDFLKQFDRANDLLREGKFEESRELLESLIKDDKEHAGTYLYNKTLSYVFEDDYDNAIKTGKKLKKKKYRSVSGFHILGAAYSAKGDVKKAEKTFEKGLKYFPNAGILFYELGNIEMNRENYGLALRNYERGIAKEPTYPANYYWASKIYMANEDAYLGLIYGEIFLNLEPLGARHQDVSEVMYKIYEDNMSFENKDSATASFVSRNMTITISSASFEEITAAMKRAANHYGRNHYQPVMVEAVLGETQFELQSLSRIRERFTRLYHEGDHPDVVVFDYQKKLLDKGYLEAYNYWLFADADEPGFVVWTSQNPDLYREFIEWFKENPLELTRENKFHTADYGY